MQRLKAILWKNYLLKIAHVSGFLAELFLPVVFMALLILIKNITDKYESPNIAYYCGNAYPWYYAKNVLPGLANLIPIDCTQKPLNCNVDNYYQAGLSFSYAGYSVQGFSQYGYITSAASSGQSSFPFYTYTIGDTTSIYSSAHISNPSLPFCTVLRKIRSNHAIFAVGPKTASDSDSSQQAQSLRAFLIDYCNVTSLNGTQDFSSSIVFFNSQSDLDNYMTDVNYDKSGYGYGKVAFAVVFYSVDLLSHNWDYAIRVNYTSLFDQNDPTVACLYSSSSCSFTYTIPSTLYHSQNLLKPQSSEYLYGYTYSAFSSIQQIVDQYIFTITSNNSTVINGVPAVNVMASVSLMPTTAYKTDNFQYIISSTLGIFYMLSFLYPVSRIIRSLVLDKETRVREGMKMMGLSDTIYNLSWLITTVLQMTVVSMLITLVTSTTVFEYSQKIFVFIYFEVFSLAVISMCFLLSSFFSKSKTASLMGPMIFFASFFPYYAVNDPQFSTSAKTATCILAPACFALGANVFADYEGGLIGVQSDNYTVPSSNFSYSNCVGMLFLDAVLYGILAWYIDKVLPSEFGTPLPYYFPFQWSYWAGISKPTNSTPTNRGAISTLSFIRSMIFSVPSYNAVENNDRDAANDTVNILISTDSNLIENLISDSEPREMPNDNNPFFEHVSAELMQQLASDSTNKCISIRGLRKEFGSLASGTEKRVAVADLNMDLFQGQVTVLLGHNGAGKSTTIGMIVGLIPPTSGNAIMPGGFSINGDMQAIRGNLGVCPQHDILFPELTALQHLQIYAVFKGVSSRDVKSEAHRMLLEVGLAEKANAKSSTLSGGQKRKLSLGIALIGNSEVVVLDEPTSGMDPYSRRSTWNIIQRNKKGRVILLTTHFMDEADLLGDRIGIMSNGKLQCMGSPLFLKNKFGVGYTLTIVKGSQTKQTVDAITLISNQITDLIRLHVPEAEPLSNVGAEQSFRLPFTSSDKFEEMFNVLDSNKNKLGIAEYGISVTTLEEVFIRVDRHEYLTDKTDESRSETNSRATESIELIGSKENSTCKDPDFVSIPMFNQADTVITVDNDVHKPVGELKEPRSSTVMFIKHFNALLLKRYIYGKRDRRMLLCQLILPVLVVVLGLSLLLIRPDLSQPDLILSPVKYNADLDFSYRNFVPFGVDPFAISNVGQQMQDLFYGQQDSGVYGVAVPIGDEPLDMDSFAGCSRGADALKNMSEFLMRTQSINEHGSSRYGAITIGSDTNLTQLSYNVMVNGSAIHGVGIYVNQVHQAFLQVLTGSSSATITTRNFPLPTTFKQSTQTATVSAFIVSLFCMIACCFIPASFAVFVVKEREVKAKHQQIISGVSIYAYWCSTYIWDTVSYLPTALLIYASMFAFSVTAYTEGSGGGAVFTLLLLFGPSTAAMTYLLSFLFVSHSTAQVVVMFFNFITGLCLMIVSFVLTTIPSTTEINLSLRYLFRLFPSFCLGDGLIQLALCDGESCPTIDKNGYNILNTETPLSWNTAGADVTFMAIECVVYFMLAVLIEYCLTFPSFLSFLYFVQDPPYEFIAGNEDVDVVAERYRVLTGGAVNDVVRIEELRKVYPVNSRAGGISFVSIGGAIVNSVRKFLFFPTSYLPVSVEPLSNVTSRTVKNAKVAVQSLCFGVPKGECFGFLGINGAGKTTTLSILSGEYPPTSGNAFIDGFSIMGSQSNIRQRIGYCPQFESLLELLTVREHLELYAKIKGIVGVALSKAVNDKIDQLDLRDFENKTAGSLSGGNKRKLTVAIATIGDPSIVFLDEPSTGMDPVSRRFMWKVIAKMSTQDAKCSVILTTHSMEEAEALCTRIGVMVNGRLRCIGSGQHLKHRFGNGYEVNIKTQPVNAARSCVLLEQISRALKNQQVASGVELSKSLLRKNVSFMSYITEIAMNHLDGTGAGLEEWERLNLIILTRAEVIAFCELIERIRSMDAAGSSRTGLIDPSHSGAILDDVLTTDGYVSLRILCEWWLAEDVSDLIQDFMLREFPGVHAFLERSSLLNFRYRIFKGDVVNVPSSSLADIFAKFERNKASMQIQEYSVGQTTLEQIFNQFAAQQDNPEFI